MSSTSLPRLPLSTCAVILVLLTGCGTTTPSVPDDEATGVPPVSDSVGAGDAGAGGEEGAWHAGIAAADPAERERTLLALAARWDPDAVTPVVAALFDSEEPVRVAAGRALAANADAEVAMELISTMRGRAGDCPVEAYQVLAAVGRSARVAALDVLVEHAIYPDVPVERRVWAVNALASLGEPGSVPVLVELARDSEEQVAGAAEAALASVTFRSDVENWGEWWLEHGDGERSQWALARVDSLVLAGLGEGSDGLRLAAGGAMLDPQREAVRADLLAAVEFLGAPLGAQALLRAARQCTEPGGRIAAVALVPDALALDVGHDELMTLLLEGFADESIDVRLAAIKAGNRGRIPEAMPACIDALGDEEEAVRYEAVTALRTFSGQHHHFDPTAPAGSAKREFAQEIWRTWWESYERKRDGPTN